MKKVLAAFLLAVMVLAGMSELSGCRRGEASRPPVRRKVRKPKPAPVKQAPAEETEDTESQTAPDDDAEDEKDDLDVDSEVE